MIRNAAIPPCLVVLTACAIAAPPTYQPPDQVGPDDALTAATGRFHVSATGAAIWNLPINVPPGRNSMRPSLAIEYDSKRGDGVLGLGFTLSGLSTVSRCWSRPAQDGAFHAEPSGAQGVPDAFCLDGQRIVPREGGDFTLEFDVGTLIKLRGGVTTQPEFFEVHYKDGRTGYFGGRIDSNAKLEGLAIRVDAKTSLLDGRINSDLTTATASGPWRILAWHMDRLIDGYGNYIDFQFQVNDRVSPEQPYEIQISRIEWTGNLNRHLLPKRRIDFEYGTRLDVHAGYQAGLPIGAAKRLSRVVVSGPDGLVGQAGPAAEIREYRFDYFKPEINSKQIDRLIGVTECVPNARSVGGMACRDPISFGWSGLANPQVPNFSQASPADWVTDETYPMDIEIDPYYWEAAWFYYAVTGDVNGDGRDDVLYRVPSLNTVNGQRYWIGRWVLRLGTPVGLSSPVHNLGLPDSPTADGMYSARLIDLNSDGRAEVILFAPNDTNVPPQSVGYHIYSFIQPLDPHDDRPIGFEEKTNVLESMVEPSVEGTGFHRRWNSLSIGDINGDGRVDVYRDGKRSSGLPLDSSDLPGSSGAAVFRLGTSDVAGHFGAPQIISIPSSGGGQQPVPVRVGEERFVVDLDGSGQPAEVLQTYQKLEDLPWLFRRDPTTFSAIYPNAQDASKTRVLETKLSSSPSEDSAVIYAEAGPCIDRSNERDNNFTRWFIDLNGDGLPDVLSVPDLSWDCHVGLWGLGDRWRTLPMSFRLQTNLGTDYGPMQLVSQGPLEWSGSPVGVARAIVPKDTGVRVVDLDKDGRQDLLMVGPNHDWNPLTNIPQIGVRGTTGHQSIVWLRSTGSNPAHLFEPHELGVPIKYFDGPSWNPEPFASSYGPRLTQVADVNGDGLADIVTWTGRQLGVYLQDSTEPNVVTKISGGPNSAYVRIKYAQGNIGVPDGPYQLYDWYRDAIKWPLAALKSIGLVVAEHAEEASFDGSGKERVYQYKYRNAVTDLLGRGTLGPSSFITVLLDEAGTQYSETQLDFDFKAVISRPASSGVSPYAYLYAANPSSSVIRRYSPDGMRTETRRLRRTLASVGKSFPMISDVSVTDIIEGSGGLLCSTRVKRDFDSFGNLTHESRERSDAKLEFDGIATGRLVSRSVARSINNVDLSQWLTNRYRDVVITSYDSAVQKRPRVAQHLWITYETGTADILRVVRSPEAASYETETTSGFTRTREVIRDLLDGSVSSFTESVPPQAGQDQTGLRRVTSYSFSPGDEERIFQTGTANALGQTDQFYLLASSGQPIARDDRNQVRIGFAYDTFGRLSKITTMASPKSPPITTNLTYKIIPSAGASRIVTVCASNEVYGQQCEERNPVGLIVEKSWDGIGGLVHATYDYDRFNRVIAASLPFKTLFELGERRNPLYIRFERDRRGRIRAVSRPGETETAPRFVSKVDYPISDALKVQVTGERGAITEFQFDFLGRMTERREKDANGARAVVTRVNYWHGDLVQRVEQPDAPDSPPIATEFEYDDFGRLQQIIDPDSGLRQWRYNAFDELKTSLDANGAVNTYAYDSLGRLTLVSTPRTAAYPSLTDWQYARRNTFTYDGPNGIGLPWIATANASLPGESAREDEVTTTFEYDELSRPTAQTVEVRGETFRFQYGYSPRGLLETVEYPASERGRLVIRNEYHMGELESVWNTTDNRGEKLIWKVIKKNAAGQSESEQFGQTASTVRIFDSSYQPRFQTTSLQPNGEFVQRLHFDWGAEGLLSARKDLDLIIDEGFSYDHLGRLEQWNVEQNCAAWQWKYGYDDRGNLKSQQLALGPNSQSSAATSLKYEGSHPHAASSIGVNGEPETSITYDEAGNLIGSWNRHITWTPFGLPLSVARGQLQKTYLYDAFGHRIREDRKDSGESLVTLGGLAEFWRPSLQADTATTYNVWSDEGLVAQVLQRSNSAEETRFVHRDHLGNPDAITAEAWADGKVTSRMVARGKYEPFGNRRFSWAVAQPVNQPPDGGQTYGFTGHSPEFDVGLINMKGRVYDPLLGRFLSPDPIINFSNSQAINPYSYVRNSPMNFVDPSGFQESPIELQLISVDPTPREVFDENGVMYHVDETDTFLVSIDAGQGAPSQGEQQDGPTAMGMIPAPGIEGVPGPLAPVQAEAHDQWLWSGNWGAIPESWNQNNIYSRELEEAQAIYDKAYSELYAEELDRHRKRPILERLGADFLHYFGEQECYGDSGEVHCAVIARIGPRPENGLWAAVNSLARYQVLMGTIASATAPLARIKPINLPAWRTIEVDIEHIASGHMQGGLRVGINKDLFPVSWTVEQVETAVRQAYRYGERISTQGERVLVRGVYDKIEIEMWVNTETRTIETAYPIGW